MRLFYLASALRRRPAPCEPRAQVTTPRVHIPLARLALCADCEVCFEIGPEQCPGCGSETWSPLSRFIGNASEKAVVRAVHALVEEARGLSGTRDSAHHLLIVGRDQPKLFQMLQRELSGNPSVTVIRTGADGVRTAWGASPTSAGGTWTTRFALWAGRSCGQSPPGRPDGSRARRRPVGQVARASLSRSRTAAGRSDRSGMPLLAITDPLVLAFGLDRGGTLIHGLTVTGARQGGGIHPQGVRPIMQSLRLIALIVLVLASACRPRLEGTAAGAPGRPGSHPSKRDPQYNRWRQGASRRRSSPRRSRCSSRSWRATRRTPTRYNWLAYATRRNGDPTKAIGIYEQALAIDPKHRGAHEYIGEAYLALNDLANAKQHLAKLDSLCFLPCSSTPI